MKFKALFIVVPLFMAATSFAQNGPPEGRDGPPRRDDGQGPPGQREPFDPAFNGPGGGGPGRNNPRPGNALMNQVELMRNWLDLIDRYARLAKDPVSAAVAAVISADDLLRGKPPEQAIEFFTKMLAATKNETVQRTIKLQLVEIYGRNNQTDKALEVLRELIAAAPAQSANAAGPTSPAAPNSGVAEAQR